MQKLLQVRPERRWRKKKSKAITNPFGLHADATCIFRFTYLLNPSLTQSSNFTNIYLTTIVFSIFLLYSRTQVFNEFSLPLSVIILEKTINEQGGIFSLVASFQHFFQVGLLLVVDSARRIKKRFQLSLPIFLLLAKYLQMTFD